MASDAPAVSLNALLRLGLSAPALHNLGASLVTGAALWGSFVSGVIAFKTLPRQQFGNLQARTFPVYFGQQTALVGALLGNWLYLHSGLLANNARALFRIRQPSSFNAWLLITMLTASVANQFVVGPKTQDLMWQRHKLERKEDKKYSDPTASDEMKQLSKRFSMMHGISSIVNMGFFLLACTHVAWIGAYGI